MQTTKAQYSKVECSAVKWTALQYITVLCDTVHCSAVKINIYNLAFILYIQPSIISRVISYVNLASIIYYYKTRTTHKLWC